MTKPEKYLLATAALVVAVLLGRSWLAEHDARIQSAAAVTQAQKTIDDLEAQKTNVQKAATAQVVVLQKQAESVKTPTQAIAALPTVTSDSLDLNVEQLPATPDKVAVDALPLYQTLNECKQTAIQYGSCTQQLQIQTDIDKQKDTQITALKAKPSFWARVKSSAITLGIGAAIGYVAATR